MSIHEHSHVLEVDFLLAFRSARKKKFSRALQGLWPGGRVVELVQLSEEEVLVARAPGGRAVVDARVRVDVRANEEARLGLRILLRGVGVGVRDAVGAPPEICTAAERVEDSLEL